MYLNEDISFLEQSPFLKRLDYKDELLCHFWQACELCIFVEYRLGKILDPHVLTEADIQELRQQALTNYDYLAKPSEDSYATHYWIIYNNKVVGIIKLGMFPSHLKLLGLYSLYLLPDYRRQGIGRLLINHLYELARGVRLETEWTYQAAIQFYLSIGFWVTNWKHNLTFVRYWYLSNYRFEWQGDSVNCWVNLPDSEEYQLCYTASRNENYLVLEEQLAYKNLEEKEYMITHHALCTLSLYLAQNGFPLIRSQKEWENRVGYSDGGMPEGLAYKIEIWEAYDRKHGFVVNTPKVPGIPYRDWDEIMNE
jgi:GNAT superfamily N-acetyltransferase